MKQRYLLSALLSIFTFITINAQVSFTANVTSGCGPLTVNFTNTSASGVTWEWNFGDGTSNSNLSSPSHTFSTGGDFYVWLSAWDASGSYLGDYNMNISVLGAPQQVYLQNDSVCPNDQVSFWVQGTGDTWEWDFGDGTTFTENSSYSGANHTYTTSGTYPVTIDVTNSCGTYTIDTSVVVNMNVPFANAPYMWVSADTVCPNTQVSMDAEQGFSSYTWNFGDGGTSAVDYYTSHTYSNLGSYTIEVEIANGCGILATVTEDIIVHNNVPVTGGYIWEVDSVCPGEEFYIQSTSNDGINYTWDFGDGNPTVDDPNVHHTYAAVGVYPVTLTITNSCGNSAVLNTQVVVSNNVGFSSTPYMWVSADSICPNTQVSMDAEYGFSSYNWSFGDGGSAVDYYASHTYSALGNYTISVEITNFCGVSTTITDSIVVHNNVPVTGGYIWEVDSVCPGEEFNIQATSNGGITYTWDFGDGNPTVDGSNINYSYTAVGIYPVTLTITNDCGNSTVVNTQVVVTNNAPVTNTYLQFNTTSVCPGDPMEFWINWEYDYYVDFGDGSGTSDGYEHTYNTVGTYPISVTYQNACGNSLTLYDTINVEDNLPFTGNPYAGINNNPTCVNGTVELYASSGYAAYSWDFGDGGTSTNKDAEHIYNAAGNYIATVEITNGCGASESFDVAVQIVNSMPITDVNYQIVGDSVCPNDQLLFTADNWNGLEYTWDFGDGTTSTGAYASHSYASTGLYIVSIYAVNGCGNDSTVIDTVIVDNNVFPSANSLQVFAQPQGCIGDELYFVVGPSGAGDYVWDFGDGNSTTSTFPLLTPEGITFDVALHSYLNTGNYEVHFNVTNGCGNTYYDTLQVQVGTIGDTVELETSFWWNELEASCQGEPIEFVAVGASSYAWSFGDGSGVLITEGSLSPVVHTYANPGTYNIVVNGYNNCGNSDSQTEEIFIPQSLIDITTNAVQLANCGENDGVAVVSATGGMPPYQYGWSNGDNSVIADSLGSGLYVITVTDNNDCSSEGIVTVDDNQGPTILVDNITNLGCYGGANGTISVSILGGAPPYEIIWSNGDQTEDIFGLVAGPYEIFVTDANGCMGMESITVTQPEEAIISIITSPSACGNNTGGAMAVISNGAPPYNYIWPNQTGPVHQTGGLAPGIHELLIIDANTCLLQQDFVINENTAPIILLDSVATGTCSGDLSSIYINTIGGLPPFTYSWSNGTTDQDLADVLPGDYDVQVMGNNGCSSYFTYSVEMTLPDENPICIVTVDTVQGGNIVVWEPVQVTGVDYYNVYKESSQSGLYYLIGTTDADSLSFYHDVNSDPHIRSWRYKIASVDDCGNESDLSDEHKTIHLTSNLGVGDVVNLIWDNYEGFSYSSFFINRYHPTTGWEVIDTVPSNLNSYTDATPPSDSNLVYQVTIEAPGLCSAQKAQDHNTTRSNRASINLPDEEIENPDAIEESLAAQIGIRPNPTNGIFTLYFDGQATERNIEIYDIQGKRLANKLCAKENKTIAFDISEFETGMYLIKISSDKETKALRLIKQ
jgi:PKD repeat protein